MSRAKISLNASKLNVENFSRPQDIVVLSLSIKASQCVVDVFWSSGANRIPSCTFLLGSRMPCKTHTQFPNNWRRRARKLQEESTHVCKSKKKHNSVYLICVLVILSSFNPIRCRITDVEHRTFNPSHRQITAF